MGASSKLPGPLNAVAQVYNPITWASTVGLDRAVAGAQTLKRAPADAAAAAAKAGQEQQKAAAGIQQQLLLQPKKITPDNFLADKAKQLANLRLGIASTVSTNPGNSPILGQTNLTGSGGKKLFGT